MTEKLGSKESAIYTLQIYLETGNDKLITRTNDLRTTYQTANFCNELRKFLSENNMSLTEYAVEIEKTKKKFMLQMLPKKCD